MAGGLSHSPPERWPRELMYGPLVHLRSAMRSSPSRLYWKKARVIWRVLFWQAGDPPFSLDLATAGTKSDARMAMMAMTTRSSIRVKAGSRGLGREPIGSCGSYAKTRFMRGAGPVMAKKRHG